MNKYEPILKLYLQRPVINLNSHSQYDLQEQQGIKIHVIHVVIILNKNHVPGPKKHSIFIK